MKKKKSNYGAIICEYRMYHLYEKLKTFWDSISKNPCSVSSLEDAVPQESISDQDSVPVEKTPLCEFSCKIRTLTVTFSNGMELSNNMAEQMMRHIKLNLKNNCLNVGSEASALNYAFMFSVMESSKMNELSPRWYIVELIKRLTEKTVYKTFLLPCFIDK